MEVTTALTWATRLVRPESRGEALEAFTLEAGADAALLLVHDADSGAMLPVAGVRQTLPAGAGWRRLLQALRGAGTVRDEVEALTGSGSQAVLAYSDGIVALVLVGGAPDATMLASLVPAWGLAGAALLFEQQQRALAGELRTTGGEMRQYAAQARTLDETRSRLDVTNRQLAEQARRAEEAGRAKDEFLAMLGHELRNPLAPIVTSLEVLRLRDQWHPELDVVKRQVQHVQRLVEDLLDVSRIARGKLSLQCETLDLAQVLTLARETGPQWARKEQQLHWQVPDAGLPVYGDHGRLVQVFVNLFDNAAKFSGRNTDVRVHAEVDGKVVRVSIHDQGVGLTALQREHVFEMFEQVERTNHPAGGLGLGLAIVRNLVSQHDGHVFAESEGPGQGSVFRVDLPLAETNAARALPDEALTMAKGAGSMRVMVVDDNADALRMMTVMLRLFGWEVLGVQGGAEALAQSPVFAPEIAVLDIGMPEMDGLTLARRLRENMGAATPRLVALTGYGQQSDRQRAKDAGFDAFLVKPVDPARLEELLHRLAAGEHVE